LRKAPLFFTAAGVVAAHGVVIAQEAPEPTDEITVSAQRKNVPMPTCDEPSSTEWIWVGTWTGEVVEIEPTKFSAVGRHLDVAIQRLEDSSAIRISPEEVNNYLFESQVPALSENEFYILVRAVFPGGGPHISVGWLGDDLAVSTASLGCAAYSNHPLVVVVDRMPVQVHVSALSAL